MAPLGLFLLYVLPTLLVVASIVSLTKMIYAIIELRKSDDRRKIAGVIFLGVLTIALTLLWLPLWGFLPIDSYETVFFFLF